MNGCHVRLLPGYAKIREDFHSYSSTVGLLQRVDVNKPLQKVFFFVFILYILISAVRYTNYYVADK